MEETKCSKCGKEFGEYVAQVVDKNGNHWCEQCFWEHALKELEFVEYDDPEDDMVVVWDEM